jgi:formylglycine-generating enzyme required for sulfatase activity
MNTEIQTVPSLVTIHPGSFTMGETADDKFATDTERPAHRVVIEYAFALGRCPVTVGEYRAFSPSHAPDEDPSWPVVNVSWEDAQTFCAWLGRETGDTFRLPTEAEWEYACRAGTRAAFATGEELTPNDANFFYAEDGRHVGPGQRTTVGCYAPNAFGLHDLHGNVCEWVEDVWHPNYLGAPNDGSAWLSDSDPTQRVIRGGAWDYLPRLLRSAWRDSLPHTHRRDNLGFRIARTLEP